MMRKKGQGLSINAIIVAVIALVVLVVLVAIFTGRIGVFSSGVTKVSGDVTKDCAAINGKVVAATQCPPGTISIVSQDTFNVDTSLCCK